MKTPRCIGLAGLTLIAMLAACEDPPEQESVRIPVTPETYPPYSPSPPTFEYDAAEDVTVIRFTFPGYKSGKVWALHVGRVSLLDDPSPLFLMLERSQFDAIREQDADAHPVFLLPDGSNIEPEVANPGIALFRVDSLAPITEHKSATLTWGAIEYELRVDSIAQFRTLFDAIEDFKAE